MPERASTPKPPRTGVVARQATLSLTAARLGARQMGRALHNTLSPPDPQQQTAQTQAQQQADGELILRTLDRLKGAGLKLAQLLSQDTDWLPPALREPLARSCQGATPMNRALVHQVFQRAFAQGPQALFAQFDPQAFAAASLGQVHAAQDPRWGELAVKVQYPGMAQTVASDLQVLKALLATLGATSTRLPPRSVWEPVVDRVHQRLLEELDYTHEAAQLTWFGEQPLPPGVVLPQVVPDRCHRRVLTLTRLPGQPLLTWLDTQPDALARHTVGQHLWDWFMHSAFRLGRLHADPHPGNFLVLPDLRLGVVDFGCVQPLSPHWQTGVAALWSALLQPPGPARDTALLTHYEALGLLAPGLHRTEGQGLLAALAPLHDWQAVPFCTPRFQARQGPPLPQPDATQQALTSRLLHQVPEEMTYFDRSWLGLLQLLHRLDTWVDTRNPWVTRPT